MFESLILAEGNGVLGWLAWSWHILLVLIGLNLVIFVHELGHFLMARFVGIKVEAFALGFGPRVVGITRGGTEYSLRAVPFGGYVKMLGQEDAALDQDRVYESRTDPRSFLAKTVGQRMAVVSAGVVMNVLFAALAFIAVFMHGVNREAAVVGEVLPDTPAAAAGIQSGDRFVRVNGARVLDFGEVKMAIMLAPRVGPIRFELLRGGRVVETNVVPRWNYKERALTIGLLQAHSTQLMYPGLASGGPKSLRPGDVIIQAGSIKPEVFFQVQEVLYAARGKPVDLTVQRTVDGRTETFTMQERAYLVFGTDPLQEAMETTTQKADAVYAQSVLGMQPRVKFLVPLDYDPEKPDPKLVQPLDVVVRAANIRNPTAAELAEFLGERRGQSVELEVLRSGERKTVSLAVPRKLPDYEFLISQLGVDDEHAVVADVIPGSPAEAMKISRGATIATCGGQPTADWFDVIEGLRTHRGQTVALTFRIGEQERSGELAVPADATWDRYIHYATGLAGEPMMTTIRGQSPWQAAQLGVRQTWYFIKQVYVMLQRTAVDKTVDVRQVGGPIFIIHAGKTFAEMGLQRLLYFFALISANLAVVNFLPIPITDGELMLLLGYEKIRGRPLTPRYAAVWQTAGLAFILIVFVLLSYNDIRRIISGEF